MRRIRRTTPALGSTDLVELADSAFDLPTPDLVDLLTNGDMDVEGRMPHSSNATLLVTLWPEGFDRPAEPEDHDPANRPLPGSHRAIYKPGQGERPLWDYPGGLYKREVATYRLAEALGWDVIPPTVLTTGPFGEGSVQAFVDGDFAQHYFTLHEEGIGDDDCRAICVLDLMANNTDRKSGHCILGRDGRIYGIDNGLTFHAQWKLRTVMWDYVGDPIPDDLLADVTRFVETGLDDGLCALLDPFEQDALMTRARAVLDRPFFPDDDTDGHRWPWPLV